MIHSSHLSMGLEMPLSLTALNIEAPESANLWMAKDSKAETFPQLCSVDQPWIQTSTVKNNIDHQEIQETLALTVKTTLLSHFTK